MARFSCRLSALGRIILPVIVVLSGPRTAVGALVRPLEGVGNFTAVVDVIDRWRDDGRLDVVVMVEVANTDLAFVETADGLRGRVRLDVELMGPDGRVITERRPIRTESIPADEAVSPTLFQNFGLILEDVPFRSGRLRCSVYDANELRDGIANLNRQLSRVSVAEGVWAAADGPRAVGGLAVGDPLFLAQAPLQRWRPEASGRGVGTVPDYMHPSRRYGLEQDRLQVFLPVWPPVGGISLDADSVGLQVTVTSLELDFALTDTIDFDGVGRAALAAGRPAGLFYELDVNLLPEGSFLFSLAPLDRQGRGQVTQFDVIWRLAALARRPAQLRGEGRTIFHGKELDRFLAVSAGEQEAMLKAFWDRTNPDPTSPVNAAYLEFQYRLAYVRQFLGGFNEMGAADPRGEVFLALGPPDEIRRDHIPNDPRGQDDARINVFNRFAPERAGSTVPADQLPNLVAPEGRAEPAPQESWSRRSENQRAIALQKPSHLYGFELWEYDRGGKPLWQSRFSHQGMGQRFLFVDRTGSGGYYLESSNVIQGEE